MGQGALWVPQGWIWGYLAQRLALGLLQLPLPLGVPQRRLQLPHAALGTAGGVTPSPGTYRAL